MNGLHITGMKLSSPAPVKKTNSNTTTVQTKPKQPTVNKSTVAPVKKPATTIQTQKNPGLTKKQVPKKVEQPKKKIQQQKKQNKVQQVIIKQEPKKVQQPPVITQVLVRYNHYKQKFQCINGVLSFAIPNQKYCFGLVFKGNYQPLLRNFKTRDIVEPLTTGKADQFSWKVDQNQAYQVQIQQDEQQQSKYQRHVYKAPQKNQFQLKKNKRVQELTNQMRNMGIQQLNSSKHRQLLQQRDLEDILYS